MNKKRPLKICENEKQDSLVKEAAFILASLTELGTDFDDETDSVAKVASLDGANLDGNVAACFPVNAIIGYTFFAGARGIEALNPGLIAFPKENIRKKVFISLCYLVIEKRAWKRPCNLFAEVHPLLLIHRMKFYVYSFEEFSHGARIVTYRAFSMLVKALRGKFCLFSITTLLCKTT
ncbi:hypothetical protein [Candidatus Similichlamydia epinepheli]|uniref:hypothetical protein n=1 Tax=Candidatus Similichlamydia epinepheli TaxID=1903953 RepID=UPI00195D1D22|nr:hypothetical protein [Candidatus Similichlamydia epinepheli]